MVLIAIMMIVSGIMNYIAEFFQVTLHPLTQVMEQMLQLF